MKETKWRIVLIIVIAIILTISFSGCAVGKGKVAVIRLSGTIAGSSQQGLLTTGGITPKLVRDYLRKAETDGGVRVVVLRIDSPGGSAAASQEIAAGGLGGAEGAIVLVIKGSKGQVTEAIKYVELSKGAQLPQIRTWNCYDCSSELYRFPLMNKHWVIT